MIERIIIRGLNKLLKKTEIKSSDKRIGPLHIDNVLTKSDRRK